MAVAIAMWAWWVGFRLSAVAVRLAAVAGSRNPCSTCCGYLFMNEHKRPVNLSLTKFSFPLPALTSITHRITGVALFGGIGFGLWMLDLSLGSAEGFARAQSLMQLPLGKFITWGLLTALAYHLLAGIKHLLLDWDIGDSLAAARMGSVLVVLSSAVCSLLALLWLW